MHGDPDRWSARLSRWPGSTANGAETDRVEDPSTSRWPWRVLLGVGLLVTLLYVVMPYGVVASALYVAVGGAAALTIGGAAYRRKRLHRRGAWLLLAVAVGFTAIADLVWFWLDLQGLAPYPSVADIFYLASYPLFMAALWVLGQREGGDGGALVDALIVGVSAAVIGWLLLVSPYLDSPNIGRWALVVTVAYPVADMILLPLVLRLLFVKEAGLRAYQFLLLGMVGYLAADILYAYGTIAGWYEPGGVIDGIWLAVYVSFMAAAWHPSASLEPRSTAARVELSGGRLSLLGATSVLVPLVIFFTAGTDVQMVRVAAMGSVFLFILVMIRMAGLMKRTRLQAEKFEALARTDALTGAANRRYLEHELAREIARAERSESELSLVFLDLDHFKRYNDHHGHAAGDVLLRDMVVAWQGVLRPIDVLARTGGEEFVVVLPGTSTHEALAVVERLRSLVPYGQKCSAGIARFRHGESADGLVQRADEALYAAKEAGRDRVVVADETRA